jgi:hypothetical protein
MHFSCLFILLCPFYRGGFYVFISLINLRDYGIGLLTVIYQRNGDKIKGYFPFRVARSDHCNACKLLTLQGESWGGWDGFSPGSSITKNINALYNHLDLYVLLLLRIPRKMGAR